MTALAIAPDRGTGYEPAVTTGVDRAIRVSTAIAVLAVAGVAAYVSYWHAYAVVCAHGETGATARLEPATIDGLVYASSMVNLYAARHRLPVPALARWLLALGIVATLAANMAQGWSHGPVGAVIAAWPAVSLVGSYELLVWIIRTAAAGERDRGPAADHDRQQPDHPWTGPWSADGQVPDAGAGRRYGQVTGLTAASEDTSQPLVPAARADQRPGPSPDQTDHPDQTAEPSGHGGGPDLRRSAAREHTAGAKVTSMPQQLLPTAAASRMVSRCRSASSPACSAGRPGAGHAAAWLKPGRARCLHRSHPDTRHDGWLA